MSSQPPAPPPPPPGDPGGMPPPPSDASAGEAADLGVRLGARAIDTILFYLVFGLLFLVIAIPLSLGDGGQLTDLAAGAGELDSGTDFVSSIIGLVLVFLFFVAFDTRLGGTPGKLMLSLRVRGASGDNPTVEESFKRNVWLLFMAIPGVIGGVLLLAATIYVAVTISQDDHNVGWHDRFAGGTTVVRK